MGETSGNITTKFLGGKDQKLTLQDSTSKNIFEMSSGETTTASKISVTNTDGNADDAIKLTSSAGGLTLTGKNTSQVMETSGNITTKFLGGKDQKLTLQDSTSKNIFEMSSGETTTAS